MNQHTALISVYDKTNLEDFAQSLIDLNWQLLSTGGTYQALQAAGIPVIEVAERTGFAEILDGRVKTLHPHIHGGILYKREDDHHVQTLQELGIHSIDMVVNTLYPFEEVVRQIDVEEALAIENIDIGGPAMIRAAAKNYHHCLVVTEITDYEAVVEYLKNGNDDVNFKRQLAQKAFSLTSNYDAMIANYFLDDQELPIKLQQSYHQARSLRYGENPHQAAAYYSNQELPFEQLHGKELSYNNFNDLTACMNLVSEFSEPVAVAIKHANPCGVAIGESALDAYLKAYETDTQSIFGGIVGFNRPIDEALASELSQIFLEVIIAPAFTKEALELLQKKKNVRLIQMEYLPEVESSNYEIRETVGGLLVQERDVDLFSPEGLQQVTDYEPTQQETQDLQFAWKVVKHLNSNAVVVAKDGQAIGLGHGEVRRSWAVEKAINRSPIDPQGAVLASDGFFFTDTIDLLAQNGIQAVIQPGGSIQDPKVIQAANEAKIAMLFTGMRHFKH